MSIRDVLTKRRVRLLTKKLRAMNNVRDIKFAGTKRDAFRFLVAFDGELPYPWDGPHLNIPVIDEEGYHTLIAEKYYGDWIFLLYCS